jgi:general secretion pathway protein I
VSRSRGFTLVEVLAALVIVALGMAAVLTTLGSSADSVDYLREKTLAQWIALNRIAEARLSGAVPAVGSSDGKIDYAGRSWRWRQQVSDGGVPGLYRIEVSVDPADAPQDKQTDWLASETGVIGTLLALPLSQSAYSEYAQKTSNGPGAGLNGGP